MGAKHLSGGKTKCKINHKSLSLFIAGGGRHDDSGGACPLLVPARTEYSLSLTPWPEQIIFKKFLAHCNLLSPLNIPLATPLGVSILRYEAAFFRWLITMFSKAKCLPS